MPLYKGSKIHSISGRSDSLESANLYNIFRATPSVQSFVSAAPLWAAIWSDLSLLISYCGSFTEA